MCKLALGQATCKFLVFELCSGAVFRERERERETDRKIDRDREREIAKERQREGERKIEREIEEREISKPRGHTRAWRGR